MYSSIITKTGSYIPSRKVNNAHFLEHRFYDANGAPQDKSNVDIIQKLQEITCINERRYADDNLNTSDVAFAAAQKALEDVDIESLDYIIVGHNFGDVRVGSKNSDLVPSIAARVKHKLGIENPYTVAFDIPFGCPGWLQGVITGNYFIRSGDAKKVLVIGAEVLSRVADPHDVDCMIYADGAGAVLLEANNDPAVGILSHVTRSDTHKHALLLRMGQSYKPDLSGEELFLKMEGHQIYKYAVRTVPQIVKQSLDKAGVTLVEIKKVFIHQANQKMDEAIMRRVFKLCDGGTMSEQLVPMTISWLGNSSVATLPTMYDLVMRGQLKNHRLESGDNLVFASVGAGMNCNALVYRVP
jgi:3-oxoacyl-[acyl-carrier-protein] synthase III